MIYTDGGADPNPGVGGYGAVLLFGPHRKELHQGYRLTTNNRMELMAVIAALQALREPVRATVYADSRYVVDAIEKGWLKGWEARGWKKIKNPDLWQTLAPLLRRHLVHFRWVPGHSGVAENERCDQLCAIARRGTLLTDTGYTPGND